MRDSVYNCCSHGVLNQCVRPCCTYINTCLCNTYHLAEVKTTSAFKRTPILLTSERKCWRYSGANDPHIGESVPFLLTKETQSR